MFYLALVILLPSAYVISAFFVYVVVPLRYLFLGFRNCCSEIYEKEEVWFLANLPIMRLPGQLGAAVPQFFITVLFLSKEHLSFWVKLQGVLTITLSCGSILSSVTSVIKLFIKRKEKQSAKMTNEGRVKNQARKPEAGKQEAGGKKPAASSKKPGAANNKPAAGSNKPAASANKPTAKNRKGRCG